VFAALHESDDGPDRRFSNVRSRAAPRVLADIGQVNRFTSTRPILPASCQPSTIGRRKRGVSVAREQRKLAAILAADVVGYSRLMGRDESGTLAALREQRPSRPRLGTQ
jgi:hypothetical protein